MLPFSDSEELIANSSLPPETLVEGGQAPRLADPEPLARMLAACETAIAGSNDQYDDA